MMDTSCIVQPHQKWVHPSVSGKIRDLTSGTPVVGASVGFQNRPERVNTDSAGRYSLRPVSSFSLFVPVGDPYFESTVEVAAKGYNGKTAKIAFGTGEVYDSSPPSREVNFLLQALPGKIVTKKIY